MTDLRLNYVTFSLLKAVMRTSSAHIYNDHDEYQHNTINSLKQRRAGSGSHDRMFFKIYFS